MVDLTDRPRLGPYVMTRDLASCALASRSVGLHEADQSSHTMYCFARCRDEAARQRFMVAVGALRGLDHPHILAIEEFAFDIGGRPWIVTPFPGDASGLVTLGRLLREKGGQMSPNEAGRALRQLLEALEHAHAKGLRHGPLGLEEVLVDRRGSLIVEFYGLERLLKGLAPGDAEMVRDEVRGVVEIGYQLVTGLRAETPLIPAGRLVKKLDGAWERWLRAGLDPLGGYDTAEQAMGALPTRRRAGESKPTLGAVRSVLGRLRPAGR